VREGKAEDTYRNRELEFATKTTQNAALQSYIDQMTHLLLNPNANDLLSEDRVREIIHARTLHALDQLDQSPTDSLGKRALLHFLYKTNLIPTRQPYGPPYDTSILYNANLRGADLEDLRLDGVDLRGANLTGANLSGTTLTRADLEDALGFTSEELEQQAASLEGATMPNGQKYEEWLKSKDSGKGRENTK
jgi:hypothetical protein